MTHDNNDDTLVHLSEVTRSPGLFKGKPIFYQ